LCHVSMKASGFPDLLCLRARAVSDFVFEWRER
jgi:hypothetical protein